MHRVLNIVDLHRYVWIDKHDVAILVQGHLESERAGPWLVLQYHLLPFDRERRACREDQKEYNVALPIHTRIPRAVHANILRPLIDPTKL